MAVASTSADLRISADGPIPARYTVAVSRDLPSVAAFWDRVAEDGVGSPFQTRAFVEAWFAHLGGAAEPLIVTGESERGDGFVIPLAVRRVGPARVACFPGGTHANTNVGVFNPAVWSRFAPEDVRAVHRAIASARPDIDLLELKTLPAEFGGRRNPFVDDRALPSPHMAYAVDLDEGFDAVLGRHKGSKKRSLLRQREKYLARLGPVGVERAATPEEAKAFMEDFFAQKAERFRQQGIPDVFGDEATRAFFRRLCETVDGPDGLIQMRALTVDGQTVATTLVVSYGGTAYMLMNSFCLGDAARFSPGEVLLYHTIGDCCANGHDGFDFGVGDARYKRSWTDREVVLFDTLVPLTALGGAAAAAIRGRRALRDFVVARPGLRRFVQRLRSGQSPDVEEEEPA